MRRKLDKLVALPADKWHAVTMKMAWHYRTSGGLSAHPMVLAAFSGTIPDKASWDDVRRKVNAARKASKSYEKRYVEAQRKANRRTYMKGYMQKYRQQRSATRAE